MKHLARALAVGLFIGVFVAAFAEPAAMCLRNPARTHAGDPRRYKR